MSKQVSYDEEARQAMLGGVNQLAGAVRMTLGPKGRNVVIDKKFGSPVVTKDGVTVAKEIDLENPMENLGAQMVREVASKTSDIAGDGTTTATVLAHAIFREGSKNVAAGANPMELKRGIDRSVESIVAGVAKLSKPVKGSMIAQVGTISANGDTSIGNIIAEAMELTADHGFNAETEKYGDLVKAGVIDPTKVVRCALQNAGSIAGLMLTTEAMVTERSEQDEAKSTPRGRMPRMEDYN